MVGNIPEHIIEEIRERSDILDIVNSYVNMIKKGDRWWGLCPFHKENTPSFSVSPELNLFYCFGCHKGGSIFNFLMEIESINFPEAVKLLSDKVGVLIPSSGLQSNSIERDKTRALSELYERVSKTFEWMLWNHSQAKHAREYIASRGISKETCETFRLGWAPSEGRWLHDFLLSKQYSHDFLVSSGLFSRHMDTWSFFVDALMFPVMPDSEHVVAFSGRSLNDRGPKYKNSPETLIYRKSQQLYGLGQAKKYIRREKRICVCEGNIDVLACYQSGIRETVAPLGTAFTENQSKILKRHADTIVFLFDGDDAGIKGTVKAVITAEKQGFVTQAVRFSTGKDPADILEEKGTEELKKIVSKPMNIFEYLLYSLVGVQSNFSGEEQEEALKELRPYLQAVGSEVRREAYLRQFSERVNANPETVIREFSKFGKNSKRKKIERIAVVQKPHLSGDELYLMVAVAVNSQYFPLLRTMLDPDLLRDGRALAIYRLMDELSIQGLELRTDLILEKLEDLHLRMLILERASTEEFDVNVEGTIRDKIQSIKIRTLEGERQELVDALSMENMLKDTKAKARMHRIKEIDQEIMTIRQGENG